MNARFTPRPSGHPARLPLAAALVMLLAAAAACGGSAATRRPASSLQDEVRVSGELGEKPTITIAAPMEISTSQSWTTIKGEGDTIAPDATAILQLTLANARTGKTVVSTLDQGQRPLETPLGDQLFPSLRTALSGAAARSRAVVASSAADTYGDNGAPQIGIKAGDPVVIVADVLATDPTSVADGPEGSTDAVPSGAPTLVTTAGTPAGFDVTGLTKPKKAQSFVLRQGTGPAIDGPTRIAADHLGVVWGGTTPFDSSYTKEPAKFSIGIGGVIPCWDDKLDGVSAGSRVVLVCPPATAYGPTAKGSIPARSTLVFLVDVLGVG